MTENLLQLLTLLQTMQDKAYSFESNECNYYQETPIQFDSSQYLLKLEKELNPELYLISQKFQVSTRAALMLSAVIQLYVKNNGIKTNFITYHDLERFFMLALDLSLFPIFREAILELEEKNILVISDLDFYLIRIFNPADQRANDYYLLPTKPSFVPMANKKIQLSDAFINLINQS